MTQELQFSALTAVKVKTKVTTIITNRKSHMRFRLQLKSVTLDDLQWSLILFMHYNCVLRTL